MGAETKTVANITAATYPDHFALTEDPVISDDNATVRLKAVDLANETIPGDTDLALASIAIKGGQGREYDALDDHEVDITVFENPLAM